MTHKRGIIFIVILCLLLPIGVHAVENDGAPDGGAFQKEQQVLDALGILPARERSQETATRAEFVSWAARLCGFTEDRQFEGESLFYDLVPGHEAQSAIAYALERGIIRVPADGKFRPEDAITVAEAADILLVVMGYDSDSLARSAASARSAILRGVSASANGGLSLPSAAKLIYNAMNEPYLIQTGFGRQNVYDSSQDETVLSHYLDIYRAEGRVTDDGFTTLDTRSVVGEKRAVVGGETFLKGDCDASRYLARNTEFYFHWREAGDDRTLLFLYPNDRQGEELALAAEEILSADSGRIVYEQDGGRSATAQLSASARIVYNGMALSRGEFDPAMLKPAAGSLLLVNTKGGSGYDVAVIRSAYHCVVDTVHRSGGSTTVVDLWSAAGNVSFEEKDLGSWIIFTDDLGAAFDPQQLTQHNILTVFRSADGSRLEVVVSTRTVKGVISEVVTGSDPVEIAIGGGSYKLTKELAARGTVKAGQAGVFYLDSFGLIAFYEEEAGQGAQFACLVKVRADEGVACTLHMKLFTQTGELRVFEVNNQLTIDGARVKEQEFARWATTLTEAGLPQLIRYEEAAGMLKWIDTTARGANEADNTIRKIDMFARTSEPAGIRNERRFKRQNVNYFDGGIFLDDDTLIFGVPQGASATDEDYSMMQSTYFLNDAYYDIEPYAVTADSDLPAAIMLRYYPTYDPDAFKQNYSMKTGIVEKLVDAVDADGQPKKALDIFVLDNQKTQRFTLRSDDQAAGLETGSLLRFNVGPKDNIILLGEIFNCNTGSVVSSTAVNDKVSVSAADYMNAWRLGYFDVLSTSGGIISAMNANVDIEPGEESKYRNNFKTSTLKKVFEYDSERKLIRPADASAIIGRDRAGSDATKMLILTKYTEPTAAVIIK